MTLPLKLFWPYLPCLTWSDFCFIFSEFFTVLQQLAQIVKLFWPAWLGFAQTGQVMALPFLLVLVVCRLLKVPPLQEWMNSAPQLQDAGEVIVHFTLTLPSDPLSLSSTCISGFFPPRLFSRSWPNDISKHWSDWCSCFSPIISPTCFSVYDLGYNWNIDWVTLNFELGNSLILSHILLPDWPCFHLCNWSFMVLFIIIRWQVRVLQIMGGVCLKCPWVQVFVDTLRWPLQHHGMSLALWRTISAQKHYTTPTFLVLSSTFLRWIGRL